MALDRHDVLSPAPVPAAGKTEISYPTPNRADKVVIERVPIGTSHYEELAPHTPHPSYDTTGLFLVWQGKVKAENNQVIAVRVYANDATENEDWYNASIKYSGDVNTFPVYTRSYIQLRETYDAASSAAKLQKVIRLRVTNQGVYTPLTIPTATITGGGGTGATCEVVMNVAQTRVIFLELTNPGLNFTSNPTVVFSGGVAAATAIIQDFASVYLVKEETSKLDSEDKQMASLFIKVHRIYEKLPGPKQVWDTYVEERGSVQRTAQSVLCTDVTGAIGSEAATYARAMGNITKTWFEPRGESSIVLTKFVETWTDVVTADKQFFTPQFGGAITLTTMTRDTPGAVTPQPGYLVVKDELKTISPDEQVRTREVFDASSAIPTLELLLGGTGYGPTAPGVSFTGGVGSGAAATAILGYAVTGVTVTAGGSLFSTPPSVRFKNALGGGALAIAVLGYGVGSTRLIFGGTGEYNTITGAPIVTFSPPSIGGVTATGTAVVGYGVYYAFITDPGGRATGTLSSDGTNVSNNHTVTIGTKVYTFKTTLSVGPAIEGEVLRGASIDASLLNLIRAINHTGTPGTHYTVALAHPLVTAASSVTAHAFRVTAIQPGTTGNVIATTETAAGAILSWGTATLIGGFSYTEVPQAIFTGDGNGADGDVVMGYPVDHITVNLRGSGFSSVPDVVVAYGVGSGFSGTAVLAYPLTSISLSVVGTGWTGTPTITIGPPETGGVQATATPVMGYGVDHVTMDARGSLYTSQPGVSFANGNGSGSTGTAFLGYTIASTSIGNAGSGYTTFPTMGVASGSPTTAATFTLKVGIDSAVVVTAGTGYAVNDILTLVGGTSTTAGQLRVTSVGGSGNVTGVSIETVGVYTAIPSNPTSITGGTPGVTTDTLTYGSPGDNAGAFNWIGTNFTGSGWVNPTTNGVSISSNQSIVAGSLNNAVNQAAEDNFLSNSPNDYIQFDLGVGRQLALTDWTFQFRDTGGAPGSDPTELTLEGSNNGVSFTPIDVQSGLVSGGDASWLQFTLGAMAPAYRYFRITSSALDSSGGNFFTFGEFEFYGDFIRPSAFTAVTFTIKYKVVQALVATPGVDYESAPTLTPSAPGGGGTTAVITANLSSTARVKRVAVTAAGSNHTIDTFGIIFSGGGGGSGAAATAFLSVTPSSLISITLGNPGSGYINIPAVGATGGGGSGMVATAALASVGVVWRVDIVTGGAYETAPELLVSGGGGSNASVQTSLDHSQQFVVRLHVSLPGRGYTSDPIISFRYANGTVPTDLAATATRKTTDGEVVSITVTNAGTLYIAPPTITFSYGTASFEAILGTTGSVVSVSILNGGLFETTPDVEFISADGSGATGTAHIATLGSVARLVFTATGSYSVAPTVVFTGSNTTTATALYHVNDTEWPTLEGFETDDITGIVVDLFKKTVPAKTPYPGKSGYRGPFIDMAPYDFTKSFQVTKRVNLNTLPPPEAWWGTYPFYKPPVLRSIEVLWSIAVGKSAEAHPDSASGTGSVAVSATSGLSGGILPVSFPAFRGRAKALYARDYFFGSVPQSMWDSLELIKITGASGSVVLVQTSSTSFGSRSNNETGTRVNTSSIASSVEGGRIGDSFQQQVHSVDIDNHLVGSFSIIGVDGSGLKYSQPVSANAVSGTNTLLLVKNGTPSELQVRMPTSSPTPEWLYSGRRILVEAEPREWKLGVWILDRIYVIVP